MGVRHLWTRIKRFCQSGPGKNALVFLVFVGVAALFWFFLTLNDEFQREIDIPVQITEIPDSVTLISAPPRTLSASVKDKGRNLVRYQWGKVPDVKIRFRDLARDGNRLVMGENQIISVLRNYFGASSQITSAKPDSIAIVYTTRPGKRVPLTLEITASADPSYVINGPMKLSTDSVTLYSPDPIPASIRSIATLPVCTNELTDTTRLIVRVKAPQGMRAIPDHVEVTIPVEPLIAKSRTVPIEVTGVPYGLSVVTFPSQVEINYLIPMSLYNRDNLPIKVLCDYNKISPSRAVEKIPLEMPVLPEAYHSVSVALDSVEYVIEQR